jgi:hypothetical protein
MPKDKIGNSLAEGDLVKVEVAGDLIGEIRSYEEGSTLGLNKMVLPAKMRIIIDITLQDGSARGVFGNLLKIYNPKRNEPSGNA